MDTHRPEPQHARTLSIHRTFLVRLYADVAAGFGHIAGQGEHVLSGEGGEFHSIEDLLRVFDKVPDREHDRRMTDSRSKEQ